jgi:hypothetical protein
VKDSLVAIISAWKASNGGRIPTESVLRRSALRDLASAMINCGFESSLSDVLEQKKIVDSCVNPKSKKILAWKTVVELDLAVVLLELSKPVELYKFFSPTLESDLPATRFMDTLLAWKSSLGGRVPNDSFKRRVSYYKLILSFSAKGLLNELTDPDNFLLIIEASVFLNYKNEMGLADWKAGASRDLVWALAKYNSDQKKRIGGSNEQP